MTDRTHTQLIKPLLRRILDFPLFAMIVATMLLDLGLQLHAGAAKALTWIDAWLRPAANVALLITTILFIYKVLVRHLGETPRDDLPFSGKAVAQLGGGMLVAFLLFSFIVAVAAALGVYKIVGHGGAAGLVNALIGIALLPAFTEELLFRGVLFRWIEEFGGSWLALALTSGLFGFAHLTNANGSVLASVGISLEAGIVLGGAYMLTRSLWAPIGYHAAWNFTQGFIFDVPVSGIDQQGLVEAKLSGPALLSGGSFGLEASLIAIVIGSVAGIWVVLLAFRQNRIVRPWWLRWLPRRAEQP